MRLPIVVRDSEQSNRRMVTKSDQKEMMDNVLLSRMGAMKSAMLLPAVLLMVGHCFAGGSTNESPSVRSFCESLERRDTTGLISATEEDCEKMEKIEKIVNAYIGLPENNRAMHGEGTFSQVAAAHTPVLLYQIFCIDHCEVSMFPAMHLPKGNPLISEMDGDRSPRND